MCYDQNVGSAEIQKKKGLNIMNHTNKILCVFICIIMMTGMLSMTVLAYTGYPPEEYKKAYNATYEIFIDSWDYHDWDKDETGTIQPVDPLIVESMDTVIYELEDGKFLLHQLNQHYVNVFEYPYPKFYGFRTETMLSVLAAENGSEHIFSGSNLHSFAGTEFYIYDGDTEEPVGRYIIADSGLGDGTYATDFKVSSLPENVQFKIHITPFSKDIECTFHGTIKYSIIEDEKITIFNTSYESNFWNWFMYILFFGWIWMNF